MISLLWCFYSLLLNIAKVKPSFCATLAFPSSQRSFVLFRVVSWIVSRSIHELTRITQKTSLSVIRLANLQPAAHSDAAAILPGQLTNGIVTETLKLGSQMGIKSRKPMCPVHDFESCT